MLIAKVVLAIVILVAKFISTKDTLVIFENIVIVFTARFVLTEVLFIVNNIKTN